MIVEYLIDIHRAIICDDNFLKKSPKHLLEPKNTLRPIELFFLLQLGNQMIRPLNRTGNKQRKEADEKPIHEHILFRFDARMINIDDIG